MLILAERISRNNLDIRNPQMSGFRLVRGFTLLEIMFVIFVSGLLISLVAPRFGGRIELYEQHQQFKELESSLNQLPRRARQYAHAFELPRDISLEGFADGLPILKLPEGWNITFTPPLRISSLGACTHSKILVSVPPPGTDRYYSVAELSCELRSN